MASLFASSTTIPTLACASAVPASGFVTTPLPSHLEVSLKHDQATLPRALQLLECSRRQRVGKTLPHDAFVQARDVRTCDGIFNGPTYGAEPCDTIRKTSRRLLK